MDEKGSNELKMSKIKKGKDKNFGGGKWKNTGENDDKLWNVKIF